MSTCYNTDGSESWFLPCKDFAVDGESACCAWHDLCLSNGFCFSTGNLHLYQGGCTVQDFSITACPYLPGCPSLSAITPCSDSSFICGFSNATTGGICDSSISGNTYTLADGLPVALEVVGGTMPAAEGLPATFPTEIDVYNDAATPTSESPSTVSVTVTETGDTVTVTGAAGRSVTKTVTVTGAADNSVASTVTVTGAAGAAGHGDTTTVTVTSVASRSAATTVTVTSAASSDGDNSSINSSKSSSKSSSDHTAAIVGGVLGACLALAIAAIIWLLLLLRKSKQNVGQLQEDIRSKPQASGYYPAEADTMYEMVANDTPPRRMSTPRVR